MRFSSLAIMVGLSACLTPTQITVKLRGVALSCPGGSSPAIQETGLLAKPQINDPSDVSADTITGSICQPSKDANAVSGELDLGDAVLVPQDGPGPVEVLAIAALDGKKTTECRDEYARLFNEAEACKEGQTCRSCIFARRSLAFVEHSSLEVRIELEPSCAGVVCDASQTCNKGACISAETQCTDANGCELTSAGGAGTGGTGGGGAGGGGVGAGGAGMGGAPSGGGGAGGGATTDWESLYSGGVFDVVGNDVDHGEPFKLFAAAGSQVIALDPVPVGIPATPAGNNTTFRAVAHSKTVSGAVAAGSSGTTSSPTFVGPLNSPTLPVGSTVRFSVAPFNSSEAAWVHQGQSGASVFIPSLGESVGSPSTGMFMAPFGERPLLFVADEPGNGARLRVFDAAAGMLPPDLLGLTAMQGLDPWSVWAAEKPLSTDQLVVVARDASEIFATTCAANFATTCGFVGSPPLDPFPTDLSGTIVDLFGIPNGANVEIFALVKNSNGGALVLAKTTLPFSLGGFFLPTWKVADVLTPEMGAPSALWVGKLDTSSSPHVFIATSTGLYKALAPVDQLFQ